MPHSHNGKVRGYVSGDTTDWPRLEFVVGVEVTSEESLLPPYATRGRVRSPNAPHCTRSTLTKCSGSADIGGKSQRNRRLPKPPSCSFPSQRVLPDHEDGRHTLLEVEPRSWLLPVVHDMLDAEDRALALAKAEALLCEFVGTGVKRATIIRATTDPMARCQWHNCHEALRGRPLGSEEFRELSHGVQWKLNWMLRPPLAYRVDHAASERDHLILFNHEWHVQAVLVPDILRGLHTEHPSMDALRRLGGALGTREGIEQFRMSNGQLFTHWLQGAKAPDSHSKESRQFHAWKAWHVCTSANEHVVVGHKTNEDAGSVRPLLHTHHQEEMWDVAMNTFLKPALPSIMAYISALPPECRPASMSRWGVEGTGCQYVGLNITPSRSYGVDNLTWEGTFNTRTGEHHGIHVHRDKNNVRGKVGAIFVLGAFDGFEQLLVPYGLSIACPHMGLLLCDSSDLLHGVSPGSGCRISIVICNHEWAETGVRPEDGKVVEGW